MQNQARIVEIGPRVGLQDMAVAASATLNIQLINQLSMTGLKSIDVGRVDPSSKQSQMANTIAVLQGVTRHSGVKLRPAVLDNDGLHAAIDAGADEVSIFIAASEDFSQKNLNCTIEKSLANTVDILTVADHARCPVRANLFCTTHCPIEGEISPIQVAALADRLFQMGCYEISLTEPLGKATRADIARMLTAVLRLSPAQNLAGSFSDAGNNALASVKESLTHGLLTYDAAITGLGGPLFSTDRIGNLDTIELLSLLTAEGYETGIDPVALEAVACFVEDEIRPHFPQTRE